MHVVCVFLRMNRNTLSYAHTMWINMWNKGVNHCHKLCSTNHEITRFLGFTKGRNAVIK